MSIFSILKYPVTEKYNVEDLSRLPPELLNQWWYDLCYNAKNTNIRSIKRKIISGVPSEPFRIHEYMNNNMSKVARKYFLKILHSRIFEIDE